METYPDLATSVTLDSTSLTGKTRVAIIATHPIQYYVPWFRKLSEHASLDVKVFYGMLPNAQQQGGDFGVEITWDIPILEGYHWEELVNRASNPSVDNFWGCRAGNLFPSLQAFAADVVIITGWNSFVLLQAFYAARRLKLPIVLRGESNSLPQRAWYKKLLHKQFLQRCDAFLYIGSKNKEFYQQNSISDDRLFHAPYFVDNELLGVQYRRFSQEKTAIRKQLGLDVNTTVFVFSGKFIDKKRPLDILLAASKLKKLGLNFQILLVGSGDLEQQLREYTHEHHLPVFFTGFINQSKIASAYIAADCFVLPSDFGETWGLVVNEAMFCGLPAIVSDHVGSCYDLIREGETGFSFRCGDIDELADRMQTAIKQHIQLSNMGKYARNMIIGQYNVEKVTQSTLKAIHRLLPQSQ